MRRAFIHFFCTGWMQTNFSIMSDVGNHGRFHSVTKCAVNDSIRDSLQSQHLDDFCVLPARTFFLAIVTLARRRKVRWMSERDPPFGYVSLSLHNEQCGDMGISMMFFFPTNGLNNVICCQLNVCVSVSVFTGACCYNLKCLIPAAQFPQAVSKRTLADASYKSTRSPRIASLHPSSRTRTIAYCSRSTARSRFSHPYLRLPSQSSSQENLVSSNCWTRRAAHTAFQPLLAKSVQTGSVEGRPLCVVVDVKVGRIYQSNNNTCSSSMQHSAVQMRYPQLFTVLTNLIQTLQQRQKLGNNCYRFTNSHVADVRWT